MLSSHDPARAGALPAGPVSGEHVLDILTDAVYAFDREWRCTYANRAGAALAERTREELVGQVLWEAYPYMLGTPAEAAYRRAMEQGTVEQLEHQCIESRDLWFSLRVFPAPDGVVSVVRDDTERERAAAAHRASEARWRAMVENASDMIVVLRPDGGVDYGSPPFQRLFGYAAGELATADALSLIHPDDQPGARAAFARLLAAPDSVERLELRYRHRDGAWYVLAVTAHSLVHDPAVRGIVCNSVDITARRLLEEELRESEQRLRAAYESLPLAVYSWHRAGDDFVLGDCNAAAVRDTRGKIRSSLGQSLADFYGHEPSMIARIHDTADGRRASRREEADYVYRTTGERRRMAFTTVAPTPDLVLVFTEDLTEQREAERALRFQAHLLGVIRESVIAIDTSGTITYWNDGATALYGWTADEALGRRVDEVIPAVGESVVGEARIRDLVEGRDTHVERILRRKDGSPVLVSISSSRILDGDGACVGVIGVSADVSQAKRAAEERIALANHVRLLLESTTQGLFGVDVRGHITFVNGAGAAMLGWSPSELVGRLAHEVMHHSREDGTIRPFDESPVTCAFRHGESARVDQDVLWRRDDSPLPVSYTVSPVWADAVLAGAVVAFTDETERRSAEQALEALAAERAMVLEAVRAKEAQFRSLIEHASDSVVLMDAQGRLRYVSPAFPRLVCSGSADLLGVEVFGFLHPADAELLRETLPSIVARPDTVVPIEVRVRHGDDGYRATTGSARNLLDHPAVGGIVLNLRDVHEQKQLEQQLRQATKMEAVGRLAGGIAHDFNNLLTVIKVNSEFLLQDLPGDSVSRVEVDEIGKAARRAGSLTRQLLAFSRQQVLRPRELDLNATVTDMGRMLARLIGEDIRLELALGDGLGRVMADPGQIEQVIANLSVNARDAMPTGGSLTIATHNVELDAQEDGCHGGIPAGAYVMLSVADTGHGMDRATLEHMFEPFFTTKPPGRGTGLGLSTVYGIVKQSEGYIAVTSEPGRGTKFRVYLPRIAGTGTQNTGAYTAASRGGAETLLLVEDEMGVRAIAMRILTRMGYTVLEAGSGREALELAERHEGRIDALITDVVMPEMSGRDLAALLRETRPDTHVMYMSGYTDDDILRRGLEPGSVFLEKPFTSQRLAAAVRELLEGTGAGT